jgi:hypothetical protein
METLEFLSQGGTFRVFARSMSNLIMKIALHSLEPGWD